MFRVFAVLFFVISLCAKERIVVLSPAINEIVYELGGGQDIVANTTYSTYPPNNKPKVGGFFNVGIEKVLSFNPTLVIMQKNNLKLKQKLKQFGIKNIVIKVDSIKDIKDAIKNIARAINKNNKAKKLLQNIDNAIKTLQQTTIKNKKILVVFGNILDFSKSVFVCGNNLYYDEIIKSSHNFNAINTNNAFLQLSKEGLIALKPDIIVILSPLLNNKQKIQKIWQKTFTKSKICIIDKDYALIPSHRVAFLIKDFAKCLK